MFEVRCRLNPYSNRVAIFREDSLCLVSNWVENFCVIVVIYAIAASDTHILNYWRAEIEKNFIENRFKSVFEKYAGW